MPRRTEKYRLVGGWAVQTDPFSVSSDVAMAMRRLARTQNDPNIVLGTPHFFELSVWFKSDRATWKGRDPFRVPEPKDRRRL